MKNILLGCVAFAMFPINAMAAPIMFGGGNYTVAENGLDIRYSSPEENFLVRGVVGNEGENSRVLITFNGKPAIYYDSGASGSQFEVYFTLSHMDGGLKVDCAYLNARNAMNGVLINKAVCGLDKKLDENYVDLIYPYSDAWMSAAGKIDTRRVFANPPKPADVSESILDNLKILYKYDSPASLSSSLPEVLLQSGAKAYSLGRKNAYIVYQLPNKTKAAVVDVVGASIEEPFKRYSSSNVDSVGK